MKRFLATAVFGLTCAAFGIGLDRYILPNDNSRSAFIAEESARITRGQQIQAELNRDPEYQRAVADVERERAVKVLADRSSPQPSATVEK